MSQLIDRIVAYYADIQLEKMRNEGQIVTPEQLQSALDAAADRLRNTPDLFTKAIHRIAVDQLDTEVQVTNEELDVPVMIDKLNYMMNVAPEFRQDLVNKSMDILGLDRPKATPIPQSPDQASPTQGQTLQSLTTAANTI